MPAASPAERLPLHDLVAVRDAEPGDEGFVYNSWLRSYRDAPAVNGTPSAVYYRYHHPLLEALLARPEVSVLVACDPSSPDRIHGWLCSEPAGTVLVCHYAYVKQIWRRKGIGSLLLAHAAEGRESVAYTFKSKAAPHVARSLGAEYVPIEEFLA